MIKLAAFDVDGTLRDRDMLPESTREALVRLRERGVELALCTGRSEYEIESLRAELGIDWAVTCNGCRIAYRGQTVIGRTFPRELVKEWIGVAERLGHTALLYSDDRMLINRADAPLFRKAQDEIGFMEPELLSPGSELPEIYQFIVFCEEGEQSAYTAASREPLYVHRWRPWAVDFNPSGMNKAVGLRKLLEHLKLTPEEAAAFGDGLNDLEMMELVGTGVAMGNACDELKDKATFVTRSLHEGGIAYAVDRLILA